MAVIYRPHLKAATAFGPDRVNGQTPGAEHRHDLPELRH